MENNPAIRVRFAPSPTGYLHIGNARTALFNYYFARRHGGSFILRIEDTDRERSDEKYTQALMEDLRWFGIDWNEGPDVGGPYGPYRQFERLPIYREHIDKMFATGRAYYCFCQQEVLDEMKRVQKMRNQPPRYDNRCRDLTPEQVKQYLAENRPHTVRFRLPDENVAFDDLIRGRVEFDVRLMGDPIIVRADGIPTFHLTVTIDDALMKVSHVLRGEDHLTNTPLHICLARAMGYTPPTYAHMSLTKGLSKRLGSASLRNFRDKGYLPEALANYTALLGWSPKDGEEICLPKKITQGFDIKDLSNTCSSFDQLKLEWVCKKYVMNADLDRLAQLGAPFLQKEGWISATPTPDDLKRLAQMIAVVRDGFSYLEELPPLVKMFFVDPELTPENAALLENEASKSVLRSLHKKLSEVKELGPDTFGNTVKEVQKETGIKGKDLYTPIRLSLTGAPHGPELKAVTLLLGLPVCLRRLEKLAK